MFSLLRRFSGSVVPRPDRPWEEDPTSNAPHAGRKRRMADEDRDEDEDEQARLKKSRGASTGASDAQERDSSAAPVPPAKETEDVKEVTQGVKEVELKDKQKLQPESVPLPEETAGELDADASSTASTPPPIDAVEAVFGSTVPETAPATSEAAVADAPDPKEESKRAVDSAHVAPTPEESTTEVPSDKLPQADPVPEPIDAPTST